MLFCPFRTYCRIGQCIGRRKSKKLKQIATLIKHEIFYDESIINSALRDMGGIKNARLVIGENFDKIISSFLQLFWQRFPKD